ncbi:hypothetical protein PENTCL1PPCAC_4485, partial [Pristionchus entomophagus]
SSDMQPHDEWLAQIDDLTLPQVNGRTFMRQSPLLTPIWEAYEGMTSRNEYDPFFDLSSQWPMGQLNDTWQLREPPARLMSSNDQFYYDPHPNDPHPSHIILTE